MEEKESRKAFPAAFRLWVPNSFVWQFSECLGSLGDFPVIDMFEVKTKRLTSHFRLVTRRAVWCNKGFVIGRVDLGFSISCATEFLCDLCWNTSPSRALASAATPSRSGLYVSLVLSFCELKDSYRSTQAVWSAPLLPPATIFLYHHQRGQVLCQITALRKPVSVDQPNL